MSAFCEEVLCALEVSGRPLAVVFVSASRMRKLNRQYRGLDYATDVLSFAYQDEMLEGMPFLGEVVIAPEIARRQALLWRSGFEREVRKLLLHGILHLLGYDHDTDQGEMIRLQRRLLRRRVFGHGDPLAELRDAP